MSKQRTGAVGLVVATLGLGILPGCSDSKTVRYEIARETIAQPTNQACEELGRVARVSLGKVTLGEAISDEATRITGALGTMALQDVCGIIEHGRTDDTQQFTVIYFCDAKVAANQPVTPPDQSRHCHPSYQIEPIDIQ